MNQIWHIVGSIGFWYVVASFGFLALWVLSETLVYHARGLEHQVWLRERLKNIQRPERSTWLNKGLSWFALWWYVALEWCYAAFKGRTLLEHWVIEAEEKDEKNTDLHVARKRMERAFQHAERDLYRAGMTTGAVWLTVLAGGCLNFIRLVTVRDNLVVTHQITPSLDGNNAFFIVFRVGSVFPDDPHTTPELMEDRFPELGDARAFCERDSDWLLKCWERGIEASKQNIYGPRRS